MTAIDQVVNIGPELAGDLRTVGIETHEQLCEVGAHDAWSRLRDAGLRNCVQSRLALEGAVLGVLWSRLDPDLRRLVIARMGEGASR